MFTIAGPPSTFSGARQDSAAPTWSAATTACSAAASCSGHGGAPRGDGQRSPAPGATSRRLHRSDRGPDRDERRVRLLPGPGLQPQRLQGRRDEVLGGHDIKAGGDCEHINAINNNFNGGAGQRIYKLQHAARRPGHHLLPAPLLRQRSRAGFVRADPSTWTIALPLDVRAGRTNTSFYAQDSWKVRRTLPINGGIRWEAQDVRDRDGQTRVQAEQELGAARRRSSGI